MVAFFYGYYGGKSFAASLSLPSCRYVEFGDPAQYGCGADMPDKICPHCGKVMYKDGFNIPFEVFLGFEGDKGPDT